MTEPSTGDYVDRQGVEVAADETDVPETFPWETNTGVERPIGEPATMAEARGDEPLEPTPDAGAENAAGDPVTAQADPVPGDPAQTFSEPVDEPPSSVPVDDPDEDAD